MLKLNIGLISCLSLIFAAPSAEAGQKPKIAHDFEACARRLLRSPNDADLIRKCKGLAVQRKTALLKMMKNDPSGALASAAPRHFKRKLPREVAEKLESKISGMANLKVIMDRPTDPSGRSVVFQQIEVNGKTYEAYTYGRRVNQIAKNIPVSGIVLDGKMAVSENAVRILDAEEIEDLKASGVQIRGNCPRSGKKASSEDTSVTIEIGGVYSYLCEGGETHAQELNAQYAAQE